MKKFTITEILLLSFLALSIIGIWTLKGTMLNVMFGIDAICIILLFILKESKK